ncbi:DUF3667 domain-containing protein [Maribacter sp. CXY002]|uniref:DUF3667 domain-containing protein n=1 Tax=Maribacter luteocoastalis TaxID=3407671 RepID=UPI003B677527
MSCKNCTSDITIDSVFCNQCGAKVVNDRITIKGILVNFTSNIFGWDNTFFLTFRKLIKAPQEILSEFLNGTRKKYMNPFTFLGIGSAIALFAFNFFTNDYLALQVDSNKQSIELMGDMFANQLGDDFDATSFKKEQLEQITNTSAFTLKYFNLFVLILIPLYTFMAKLVYGKPYNYAEHLVINSYIQGITFWVTTIMFIISIYTFSSIYFLTVVLSILFYSYVYGKLYKLTFGQSVLKIIIFLGILMGVIIALFIVAVIIGIVIAFISSKF